MYLFLYLGVLMTLIHLPNKYESFFYKYQTLDSQVLNDLNNVIDNDKRFDETTGKGYSRNN